MPDHLGGWTPSDYACLIRGRWAQRHESIKLRQIIRNNISYLRQSRTRR